MWHRYLVSRFGIELTFSLKWLQDGDFLLELNYLGGRKRGIFPRETFANFVGNCYNRRKQ